MNLEVFQDLKNRQRDGKVAEDFMAALSKSLKNDENKQKNQLEEQNNNREENTLYQVVDFSSNGVFLQNTNSNIVFEEKNLPKEIIDKIGNDYILRYQNGKYIVEESLTEDFMNHMVGVQEYRKIKETFIKNSNILEISSDTLYHIQSQNENSTILTYGENYDRTIEVPNELIPYFINEQTVLYYTNGKFEKWKKR